MTFGATYRAIDEMILDEALETPMARAIARKAGLRSAGEATRTRALTAVDAYIDPIAPLSIGAEVYVFSYQWLVDFTGATQVRATSQADTNVFLNYADPLSTAVDAVEYPALTGFDELGNELNVGASILSSSGDLGWLTLAPERRVPLRIVVFPQEETSYSFALQVR